MLRPEVLLAAVLWEDTEAINQAKQLLHNFLTLGTVIPANLREVCFNPIQHQHYDGFFFTPNYGIFRLFILVQCCLESTPSGNTVGRDTYRYVDHPKGQLNVCNYYVHWGKQRTHGSFLIHFEKKTK